MRPNTKTVATSVLVMVLDTEPTVRNGVLGCAGHEFFRGRWDETPENMAAAVGRELGESFDVHTVTETAEQTIVVLRWATRYSHVEARARQRPTLVPAVRRVCKQQAVTQQAMRRVS